MRRLSQNLSRLMWEGPEAELTLTENAQPALMAVSLAAMRVLGEKGLKLPAKVAYVAGHSLGEYSALAAAGALSLADTARLLKIRGRAMQEAVPVGQGRDGGAARRRSGAGARSSPRPPPKAKCAKPPTTMRRARW